MLVINDSGLVGYERASCEETGSFVLFDHNLLAFVLVLPNGTRVEVEKRNLNSAVQRANYFLDSMDFENPPNWYIVGGHARNLLVNECHILAESDRLFSSYREKECYRLAIEYKGFTVQFSAEATEHAHEDNLEDIARHFCYKFANQYADRLFKSGGGS